MATPKSLAFKATLLLDPEYEYLRKSCSESHGYALLRHPETKKMVLLHRYLQELENITVPDEMTIDHVDRNKANNRHSNLKIASRSENSCNRGLRKGSATRILGLSLYTYSSGKQVFQARVKVKGNKPESRYFELSQKQEAIAWLEETRAKLHGDFANNG